MPPVARSYIADAASEYIHPTYVRLARSANSTLAVQSRSFGPDASGPAVICVMPAASSVHAVMPEAVVAGLGEVRETVRVLADLDPMQDVTISRTDTTEKHG